MDCSACGRENRTSAAYCAWCGAGLSGEAPPEPAAAPRESGAVTRKLDLADLLESEAPLESGIWLDGRYEITELLEVDDDCRTYEAVDHGRCPGCGRILEEDEPAAYCQECGAALDVRPRVMVVEYLVRRPETYATHWQHGGRDYYVIELPEPGEQAGPETVRLTFGSATHPGYHYDHNEDSLEARLYADHLGTSLGFFVVADGVGGQQGGEIASRLAINVVWEQLYGAVWQAAMLGEAPDHEACEAALSEALLAANAAVYAERTARASEMGTTLTAALTVGRRVYVGNVGDSRAYLFGGDGLRRITQDHSLVQRMVDAGQLLPDEVYTHPRRNVIYRSIGDRPRLEADTFAVELGRDARLVLCSDGLWEMVREDGLEEILLAESDPQQAADRLVQNALLAGGADNISVIIVQAVG
jgi:serine/threonine protein phosphatase PrpC